MALVKTTPESKAERTPEVQKAIDELAKDVSAESIEKVKSFADGLMADMSRKFTPAMGTNGEGKDAPAGIYKELARNAKGDMPPATEKELELAGYAKAVYAREHGKELTPEVRKALGETTGSTGGFLIPYEFRPELLKLIIEDQVVRPRAQVVPMATDTLIYPRINDTSHATTIHGGVKGTWTAEASALGTGDPAFGQLQLIAKKFSDYVTVSNELLNDSPVSMAPLLGNLLREGLGFFEDVDFLTGSGANKPRGISTSSALVSLTSRAVTSHINYADIVGMQTRLFPSSYKRAVWVCSPGALNDLLQMTINVGAGGSAVFITNIPGQSAADTFPMSIFGRPLIISEKMADLGTAFDIMVFDPTYYIIGDRMDLSLTSSEHVAFATDQTAFRIIERLDGAPWINSPLTPNNGGATLSAFVALPA
jgi:HK97 family phage major capsid protein